MSKIAYIVSMADTYINFSGSFSYKTF